LFSFFSYRELHSLFTQYIPVFFRTAFVCGIMKLSVGKISSAELQPIAT
jgi:hypothetical protein